METRRRRGWWPYVAPYGAFLLLVELQRFLPEGLVPWMLPLKVAVPGVLLVAWAWRGAFPELRGFRPGAGLVLDVGVGLALAALWVGPFLLFDGLPRGRDPFEPEALGAGLRSEVLALRLVGFAAVTPFLEELFVRSFLLRLVDVLWEGRGDFRELPIGRFRWPSFVLTTVWFTLSHDAWEWPVAAPTGALFTLWLCARRHIGATIVAHAVTNATVWALVVRGPFELWAFL